MLEALNRQNASLISGFRATLLHALLRINWRYHLGGSCAATAFGLYLREPSINSPLLPLGFCLLWCSVLLVGVKRPSSSILALVGVIAISAWLAVPLSLAFDRSLAATLLLAVFISVSVPLLLIKDIKPVFYWLIPVWFLQASVMAWQWFAEGVIRAGGIAENENTGSSFLLIGAIFLASQPRLKWLAAPLLIAMAFSGSRWVMLVGLVVFGLIFLAQKVNWRYLLIGILLGFTVVFATQSDQLKTAFRVYADPVEDIRYRANAQEAESGNNWKLLIPRGFHDTNLHSLPLRMADELGLLAVAAWIGLGAMLLIKRPLDWRFWALLAVYLLSGMYYFTFFLLPFWWLLIGQKKAPQSNSGGFALSFPGMG